MEQLLTANVASNMYWLGRYLQRVESTLYKIDKAFDKIIDVNKDAGTELYNKFGIELKYTDAVDFLKKAICGEHPSNIATIMNAARESAIISRTNIDDSAFGEIIALEALFRKISNCTLPIDNKDIDYALSLIREIWGANASRGHKKSSDYFLKLGKLVEEVDFHLRFDNNLKMTQLVLRDINNMLKLLSPEVDLSLTCPKEKDSQTQSDLMDSMNKIVNKLIIHD